MARQDPCVMHGSESQPESVLCIGASVVYVIWWITQSSGRNTSEGAQHLQGFSLAVCWSLCHIRNIQSPRNSTGGVESMEWGAQEVVSQGCNVVQVNWPTLWMSWRERELREIIVLPIIVLIMLVPVGAFSGAAIRGF